MKCFLIFYEPFDERLELPESELIHAENEGKAREYFKAIYQQRILKVIPIKQF